METSEKARSPKNILNLRSKYYKAFLRRVSAKAGNIARPDKDQKLIVKLQAELKCLAFKFQAVFDSSNSYYVILDKQMNILDYNRASYRLIKKLFDKKMFIGESILEFLHPASAKMITESCDKAFGGEKLTVEKKIGYRDNIVTWWCFEFSPAIDLRGNITGVVFNANDITKRKAYEEKVISQHKKLMEISTMQSHEIRGPVSTIMGLMSLIKEDGYSPGREYLLLLETTANLLDKNIRDIVNLADDDISIQGPAKPGPVS
ncbi:hypothetical protein BH09BAC6_BH09BAC6_12920 [soil metagenome]|jgi:PAS domain S-box-containing protein